MVTSAVLVLPVAHADTQSNILLGSTQRLATLGTAKWQYKSHFHRHTLIDCALVCQRHNMIGLGQQGLLYELAASNVGGVD